MVSVSHPPRGDLCKSCSLAGLKTSYGFRLVETNSILPSHICRFIPGLTRRQVRYCQKYPWIMHSIEKGLQSARDQCQKQFSNYGKIRWNCSTVNSASVFKPIMQAGEPSVSTMVFLVLLSVMGVAFFWPFEIVSLVFFPLFCISHNAIASRCCTPGASACYL